jgi:hypothetical protein
VAQRLQGQEVVLSEDRRNDDSAQSARAQHAIHGEPSRAPVSVVAREDFAFFEAYFSNYIEGTTFEVEEAESIIGLMTAAGSDIKSSFTYVRIIGEKEKAVIGVGIPALGIYKPSVIFGNSNTPSYLRYVFPAVQRVLPSRYHSIHKNELARAMFEGTQKALAELQQKQAQGGALPGPEVKSYEYSDMKPLFNKDGPKDWRLRPYRH